MDTFDEKIYAIETFNAAGSGNMSQTLDNDVAVDNGDGTVQIPITGHGYKAESYLYFNGTTNYDGMFYIPSVDTDYVNIKATFVEETFSGSETVTVTLVPRNNSAFELREMRFHVDASVSTDEDLVLTLDSGLGSDYDVEIERYEMQDLANKYENGIGLYYTKDDKIVFTFPNTDTNTWGLEVKYRVAH